MIGLPSPGSLARGVATGGRDPDTETPVAETPDAAAGV